MQLLAAPNITASVQNSALDTRCTPPRFGGVKTPAHLLKTPRELKYCACGCGKRFLPKRPHQKFLTPSHRWADWQAKHPRQGVSPKPGIEAA